MTVRRMAAVLLVSLSGLFGGCAGPPPPPHPMGAACTWPTDLQPARDDLAILFTFGPSDRGRDRPEDRQAILYHVPTGTIRARCSGIGYHGVTSPLAFSDQARVFPLSARGQGVAFPPISADYRLAITVAGVLELSTGELIAAPDPDWPAVGMVGATGVLRQARRSLPTQDDAVSGPYDGANSPSSFCVAARPDSPQDRCTPVPGAEDRGQPLITTDGRVEWVPRTSVVPLTLTEPDGATFTGLAEVGPTEPLSILVNLYPGRADPYLRGDQRFESFSRMALPFDPGTLPGEFPDSQKAIQWYTIDAVTPAGVTGTLHTSMTTYGDPPGCGSSYLLTAGIVEDGGGSIVIGCAVRRSGSNSFVRISRDGPPELLGTLPVGQDAGALPYQPTIFYWPPAASPNPS